MYIEGLFDRLSFPDRLAAHVVTPEAEPRICGYSVREDLAAHVGLVETGWLALTGELPTPSEREALQTALVWLSPVHVGESPAHAAVLARTAGGSDDILPALAALAHGQHAAAEISSLAGLGAWLDGEAAVPAAAVDPDPSALAEQLHDRLVEDSLRWFGPRGALPRRPVLSRVAAAHALLHRLGAGEPLLVQTLSLWARLPVLLAEARHVRPGSVKTYPARTPEYRYTEETP